MKLWCNSKWTSSSVAKSWMTQACGANEKPMSYVFLVSLLLQTSGVESEGRKLTTSIVLKEEKTAKIMNPPNQCEKRTTTSWTIHLDSCSNHTVRSSNTRSNMHFWPRALRSGLPPLGAGVRDWSMGSPHPEASPAGELQSSPGKAATSTGSSQSAAIVESQPGSVASTGTVLLRAFADNLRLCSRHKRVAYIMRSRSGERTAPKGSFSLFSSNLTSLGARLGNRLVSVSSAQLRNLLLQRMSIFLHFKKNNAEA